MVEKMQMTGNRLPIRPKGTLEQLVQRDMKKKGLKEEPGMVPVQFGNRQLGNIQFGHRHFGNI